MKSITIKKYGPLTANAGTSFNIQSNGYSAIWFELYEEFEQDLIVQLDGFTLRSVQFGTLLTALVPEVLIQNPGIFSIKIFFPDSPENYTKLPFQIIGKSFYVKKPVKSNNLPKPNFFIIGAPRSGTTSMYWHLSAHPKIFMSKIKEPYYFDERAYLNQKNAIKTLKSYLSLFRYAPYDSTIIGEASTTYLSSIESISKIKDFCPSAKLLVMLRNPFESAISLFLRHREGGINEDVNNFNTAWSQCDGGQRKFINDYKEIFKIGDQLEYLFRLFREDRIKTILFDDLLSNSISVYKEVLLFLNLKLDRYTPIIKGNSSDYKINNSPIGATTYQDMAKTYFPQIEKTSILIGCDLNHWKLKFEDLK